MFCHPRKTRPLFELLPLLNDSIRFHSFENTDWLVHQSISLPVSYPSKAIWECHPTSTARLGLLPLPSMEYTFPRGWLQHPSAQVWQDSAESWLWPPAGTLGNCLVNMAPDSQVVGPDQFPWTVPHTLPLGSPGSSIPPPPALCITVTSLSSLLPRLCMSPTQGPIRPRRLTSTHGTCLLREI